MLLFVTLHYLQTGSELKIHFGQNVSKPFIRRRRRVKCLRPCHHHDHYYYNHQFGLIGEIIISSLMISRWKDLHLLILLYKSASTRVKVTIDIFCQLGLNRTGHMSFLTRPDRTPKFAGQVLPDRTESGLVFLTFYLTSMGYQFSYDKDPGHKFGVKKSKLGCIWK
jgi:hypothetical protein